MVQEGRDPLSGEIRSKRTFSEVPTGRTPGAGLRRDVDLARRTANLKAWMAAGPGFVLGVALAVFLVKGHGVPVWVSILAALGLTVGVGSLAAFLTHQSGKAGTVLYNPSGRTTPPKKEYSYAESLVARGAYEEAVTAFELAVAEDAADPTPYLRIARVYRDHLERHEDAARWFRRALREATISVAQAALARKELIELYIHRMGAPNRAAPELARMAEELAGTPEGEWAARELADVKDRMAGEFGGSAPDDA